MNLLTIFTNVAITGAISFNGKYNEVTISHGQKHLRPMTLPYWTNQNVFPLLSSTTQPFVLSHHYSQTLSHPYFIPPPPNPPCSYNGAAPIVAYRRSSNLSDFLVRAETSQSHTTQPALGLLGNQPWVRKVLSRLVNTYMTDKLPYTFHATGETGPITNHIDCNSKNVIYMIQCNHCSKQCRGETKRRRKRRLKDHFNGRPQIG